MNEQTKVAILEHAVHAVDDMHADVHLSVVHIHPRTGDVTLTLRLDGFTWQASYTYEMAFDHEQIQNIVADAYFDGL